MFLNGLDALAQAAIICVLGILIIVSNTLIIATLLNYKGKVEVINYYILSLAVADLLGGLLIIPFSVYPTLTNGNWIHGDLICCLIGYLEVTLLCIYVYTFMWISVDRYLAVRKPLRYDTVQTKTRCQCWCAFTWISAAMLCCPPLLGYNKPIFDKRAFVCFLDWKNMAAYTVTLSILVLGPSVISLLHNYTYIFVMRARLRSGVPIHDKEYATALAENLSNPSHVMSFALVISFWVSWGPLLFVCFYESVWGVQVEDPTIHFAVVWFGALNSCWKFIILTMLSPHFRIALRIFCLTLCCRTKASLALAAAAYDSD